MGPKQRITRDVRMTYNLFIEEVRGAIPGRSYVVNFSRGEKITGSTVVKKADEDGNVLFNFIAEFTVTLQRKNFDAYKKKDLHLEVVDIATGMPTCDIRYNIATPIVNEELPLKKMIAKNDTGEQSLWFGLSAMTENAVLTSTKGPAKEDVHESPAADMDDSVIDDAIDAANSGRRANSARRATPNSSRAQSRDHRENHDNQPAAVAAPQRQASRTQQSEARSVSRDNSSAFGPVVQEEEVEPAPKVTVKKQRSRTDSANFSHEETAAFQPEEEAAVVPPKKQPSSSAMRQDSQQQMQRDRSQSTQQQQQRDRSQSAQQQQQQQQPTQQLQRNDSQKRASPTAPLPPQSPPHSPNRKANDGGFPAAASDVARWLAVIGDAAYSAPSSSAKQGQVSHIPKGSLLILSALKRWRGEKRLAFVHDFILYLYQDVLRHTRHYGAWINILVHVLYDALSQVEGLDSEEEQMRQEEEEQQVADELLEMLEDRQLVNETLTKSYIANSASTAQFDDLSKFLRSWVRDDVDDNGAQDRMSSSLVVIISVTADDILRRLCSGLTKKPIQTLKQVALPPNSQPAWATNDGYTLALPILKAQEVAKKAMVQTHMVENANIALLINTLDALYEELLPPQPEGSSNPPLMRLTTIELFKIIIRNVAAAFLNNLTKDGNFVVKTAKDALNLKLSISLVERWLQEHQLYMSCRAEFLPLRQFIDVAILQKKVLAVPATRNELAKHLPVPFLHNFLLQFESNPRDLEEDTVPADLLKDLELARSTLRAGLVDKKMTKYREEGRQINAVARRDIEKEADAESSSIQAWKYASVGNFPFFDFLYGLLPTDEPEEGAEAGPNARKSMRRSVRQSIRKAHHNDDGTGELTARGEKSRTNLSLDWDVQYEYLATAEDMESIFPEANKEFVNVRLAALSLPNEELLDSIAGY